MPTVESRLNKLHGSKFFTAIDCITGYWQIRLSERAKNLVAFTTNKGLYTFNYMPFGLCNASATFQRVIEKVIQHLLNTLAFVDDLLTFSKTFEDHLEHLKLLFERLKLKHQNASSPRIQQYFLVTKSPQKVFLLIRLALRFSTTIQNQLNQNMSNNFWD